MPVAFVQEFPIQGDDRTTANYDAISERLNAHADPPAGLIVHTAGFDEEAGVFRILDVWETEEHGRRFQDERVMPLVEEIVLATDDPAMPTRDVYYALHDVIKGA
jgi:hypothetical protein